MLSNSSLVLSVGIATDVTFDVAVARRFGARVFAADPTITRAEFWQAGGRHRTQCTDPTPCTFSSVHC